MPRGRSTAVTMRCGTRARTPTCQRVARPQTPAGCCKPASTGSPAGLGFRNRPKCFAKVQYGLVRWTRVAVALLLVASLAACNQAEDEGTLPPPPPPPSAELPPPPPPQYQVLDAECPEGWKGLLVTTDNEAEVDYLDDIPACTDDQESMTFLRNESDSVWTLGARTPYGGTTNYLGQPLSHESFLLAVAQLRMGRPILAPGASAIVDLPPDSIEWVIDLPLSVGWEAHDLVLDKLRSTGEAATVAALQRRSQAGAALGACALAATQYAESVDGLEDANATEVILRGLGVGSAISACRIQALAVITVDEAGRSVALADELARLRGQTALLQTVEIRLGYAQRAARVLTLGFTIVR